jgi:hypothetical protein
MAVDRSSLRHEAEKRDIKSDEVDMRTRKKMHKISKK